MSSDKLKKQLESLLQDIDQLNVESDKRAALEEVITAIESRLAPEPALSSDDSLVDQVDSLALRFDVEHPDLSASLKNIMITLSSMGV